MINMERLLLYRNLLNLENSNETLAMLNNYCDINDFMGKFEILVSLTRNIYLLRLFSNLFSPNPITKLSI